MASSHQAMLLHAARNRAKQRYLFLFYLSNKHKKCKTKVLIFFLDKNSLTMVIFLELRSVKFSTQLDLSQIKFTPSIVLNYSHVRICWRSNAANFWNCVILFSKYLRGINLPLNHAKGSHYVVRSPRQCFLRSDICFFFSKLVIFKTLPLVSKKF